MSTKFIQKNIKLSLEFDKYISHKPEMYRKIPNKSTVFFTVKGDTYFNKCSRDLVRSVKKTTGKVVEARKEGSKWQIYSYSN